MRIGISARLAKTAFAQAFAVSVDDVEEYWHGQTAPYLPLFDWAARGVAMANAHPELKAVADEVTLSNEDDGVAVVLERLFPQG